MSGLFDPGHDEPGKAATALRRTAKLVSHFALAEHSEHDEDQLRFQFTSAEEYSAVSLGGVTLKVEKPSRIDLVPNLEPVKLYGFDLDIPEILSHLKWMFQKASLGQDIFLLGPPGPFRRWLAYRFCNITRREAEFIALTRDTTESDLKQRREIQNGSVVYVDQPAVRAAIHGRVLILEGLEKCERNVLPVLNNLLENREMHLEDGRFLVNPKRYEFLKKTHTEDELKRLRLVPVHPRFQVIALGLPVPRFEGNPLDPPLRSRFQARNIEALSPETQLSLIRSIYSSANPDATSKVVALSETLHRMQQTDENGAMPKMLHFPLTASVDIARLLHNGAQTPLGELLLRVYPFEMRPDETERNTVHAALSSIGLGTAGPGLNSLIPTSVIAPEGARKSADGRYDHYSKPFVQTGPLKHIIDSVSEDQTSGFDICIIGEQGSGKTRIVQRLSELLHTPAKTMQLYKDMTARDFIQRRSTDEAGNTVWINSPLVECALDGAICILDGVHRLAPGVLAVLQQLIHDREIHLLDGTTLVKSLEPYISSVQQANNVSHNEAERIVSEAGLVQINPAFRIIALGNPPTRMGRGMWLTSEVTAMFHFHLVRDPSWNSKLEIVDHLFPQLQLRSLISKSEPGKESPAERMVTFVQKLEYARKRADTINGGASSAAGSADSGNNDLPRMSLRQLIRLCKRISHYPEDLAETLENTLLVRFLPPAMKDIVVQILGSAGIRLINSRHYDAAALKIEVSEAEVRIGDVAMPRHQPRNPALVPRITFFPIPSHIALLREMLKDLIFDEHILLIGNQGVGKNILADRVLEILRIEREYIQLHRDTTVQTLTLSPSIQDGVIVWEDSPLVRAVSEGRALVIDEADKAPLEVVCVLKGLIEDGEMLLADGRRILHPGLIRGDDMKNVIPIHKNFRMVVLANRPGYPFLGNNFFRECGDCFAVHIVDNPDKKSEFELLRAYGPSVDAEVLNRLIALFGDLRDMVDQGILTYPYSLRELVNIVKHLEAFSEDTLSQGVDNVFQFDSYDTQLREHLGQVFSKHGIPLGTYFDFKVELAHERPLPMSVVSDRWSMVPLEDTKDVMPICNAKSKPLKAKGTIKCTARSPTQIKSRRPGRIQTFTELKSSWLLDVGGVPQALACGSDGSIYVLTSHPFQLIWFEPSMETYRIVPLADHIQTYVRTTETLGQYVQSPTLAALPNGELAVFVSSYNMVLLVHPQEGTIRAFDLSAPEQESGFAIFGTKIYVNRLTQQKSMKQSSINMWKMVDDLASQNILLFTKNGGMEFIMFDLKEDVLVFAQTPDVQIMTLHPLTKSLWLVQSRNETKYYIQRLNNGEFGLRTVQSDQSNFNYGRTIVNYNYISSQTNTTLLNTQTSYIQVSEPSIASMPSKTSINSFIRPVPTYFELRNGTAYREGNQVYSTYLHKTSQVLNLNLVPSLDYDELGGDAPTKSRDAKTLKKMEDAAAHWALEVVNLPRKSVRTIRVSPENRQEKTVLETDKVNHNYYAGVGGLSLAKIINVKELPNGDIVTLAENGRISVYEVDQDSIQNSLAKWRMLVGNRDAGKSAEEIKNSKLTLSFDYDAKKEANGPTMGKIDPKNDPHVGGNMWQGGSGGSNTPGMGGRGGPFRVASGNNIYQISDAEKQKVSQQVSEAAREMAKKALAEKLSAIGMSELDEARYERLISGIKHEIRQLRNVLEAAQAKSRERTWLKLETQGEIDENRLVDSITGEKNVYKRRGKENPGMFQEKPKRLRFVLDVSGSMYRFNSDDKRLDRLLEVALIVMESLQGFEHKYTYSIVGHSGDSPEILFVDYGKPPKNRKERLQVLDKLVAHSQFCATGDHTLQAADLAVKNVAKEEADEYLVFVFSDANISRYDVSPEQLTKKLQQDPKVSAYIIFIASFADEAAKIRKEMPVGKAYVCLDTATLPNTFKQIFMSIPANL